MADLTNDEQILIRREFEGLVDPVTVKVTVPAAKNDSVPELRSLLDNIAALDERVKVEYSEEEPQDSDDEPPLLPVTALIGADGSEKGISYYGVPSMLAMESFVKAIMMVSSGEHGLDPETVEKAKALGDTNLEVLYTPNTPGCSQSMDIANRLAIATGTIAANNIEIIEFPQIAEKYNVLGVPKTVANGSLKFTGLYSLDEVLQIIEKKIGDVED